MRDLNDKKATLQYNWELEKKKRARVKYRQGSIKLVRSPIQIPTSNANQHADPVINHGRRNPSPSFFHR